MVVLAGGAVSYARGTPVRHTLVSVRHTLASVRHTLVSVRDTRDEGVRHIRGCWESRPGNAQVGGWVLVTTSTHRPDTSRVHARDPFIRHQSQLMVQILNLKIETREWVVGCWSPPALTIQPLD